MITKLSSYKSLVNNDLTSEQFLQTAVFKTFLTCKFSSFSCKKMERGSCLKIQGLATTYNNVDFTKDVLINESFSSQVDSDGFFKKLPFMYYEHDSKLESPGIWKEVRLLPIGIQVKGEVSSSLVLDLIHQEKLSGLSIGFYIHSSERVYNHVKNKYYRYIKSAELVEISLVSNPANSKAFFSPTETLYYGEKHQSF